MATTIMISTSVKPAARIFFGLHFLRRIHVFAGRLVTKPRRLSTPASRDKPRYSQKLHPLGQALGLFIALGQVVAPDLVIVTQIDTTVGKRGVGPDEHPAGDLVSGLDEFGATNLIVSAWLRLAMINSPKSLARKNDHLV